MKEYETVHTYEAEGIGTVKVMREKSQLIVCDTPDKIAAFRLLSLLGRLRLESKGLKFRGASTFSIVKKEFNFRGNNAKVLAQYEAMLREKGVLA